MSPATLKFDCPSCGQRISAEAQYAGMNLDCPACQHAMQVPSVATLQPSSPAPVTGTTTNAATKACPMCGETILAVAKKCRYCGEYFDQPARPDPLKIQVQMKSEATAVILSLLLWPFGCLYSSGEAFGMAIAGVILAVFLELDTGSIGCLIILIPFYLASVGMAIRAVGTYNESLLQGERGDTKPSEPAAYIAETQLVAEPVIVADDRNTYYALGALLLFALFVCVIWMATSSGASSVSSQESQEGIANEPAAPSHSEVKVLPPSNTAPVLSDEEIQRNDECLQRLQKLRGLLTTLPTEDNDVIIRVRDAIVKVEVINAHDFSLFAGGGDLQNDIRAADAFLEISLRNAFTLDRSENYSQANLIRRNASARLKTELLSPVEQVIVRGRKQMSAH